MAQPQDHRRAAAGRPAQDRLALRPGGRGGGARCERARCAPTRCATSSWIAELGLDGRLRPVRGRAALGRRGPRPGRAPRRRRARATAPRPRSCPASTCGSPTTSGRSSRGSTATGRRLAPPRRACATPTRRRGPTSPTSPGRPLAKRAIEVAAAGGHHLFLEGAPGAGKTMLAERLPGLLPELDDAAALEVSAVHSVAGLLGEPAGLVRRAPFQAPHHTASVASLVGGGSHLAQPGAISLAHRGVLFLDEAPEFAPRALEALRQPLEGGRVVLHRSGGRDHLSGAVPARARREPVPVRQRGRATASARRRSGAATSSGCPVRCSIASTCGCRSTRSPHAELLDTDGRPRDDSATVAARVAARAWRGHRALGGTPWRCNARRARCGAAPRVRGRCRRRRWHLPRSTCGAASSAHAASTGCCGCPGRSPTWRAATVPAAERRRRGVVLPHRRRRRGERHDGRPDDEVLLARAYLSRVGEPASIGLWRYVQAGRPGRGDARDPRRAGAGRRCSPRPRRGAARPTRTPTSPPPSGTACGWSCPSPPSGRTSRSRASSRRCSRVAAAHAERRFRAQRVG